MPLFGVPGTYPKARIVQDDDTKANIAGAQQQSGLSCKRLDKNLYARVFRRVRIYTAGAFKQALCNAYELLRLLVLGWLRAPSRDPVQ